jgi:hypothetical protein
VPGVVFVPAGWLRGGGAAGRPAAFNNAIVFAVAGIVRGVPVVLSRMIVIGSRICPRTAATSEISCAAAGPDLPSAAVLYPYDRANASNDASRM